MKRRFVSSLLVALMLVMILTACGTGVRSLNNNSSSNSSTTSIDSLANQIDQDASALEKDLNSIDTLPDFQ